MPITRVNEVDLSFVIGGKKTTARLSPTLLAACLAQIFDPFVRAIGSVNPVITFDYRGTGKSSIPQSLERYSAALYADDMLGVLRAARAQKAVVFGYSHGGYFAVNFALTYPEKVEALVLGEPALFTPVEELKQRAELVAKGAYKDSISLLLQQISPELRRHPALFEKMANAIQKTYHQPIGLEGEYRARALHPISEAQLSELKMPVMLIGGSKSAIRERTMYRVARAIPNASVFWIPDATHMFPIEKPQLVGRALECFLRGIRSNHRGA